jgi:hypothetical protein
MKFKQINPEEVAELFILECKKLKTKRDQLHLRFFVKQTIQKINNYRPSANDVTSLTDKVREILDKKDYIFPGPQKSLNLDTKDGILSPLLVDDDSVKFFIDENNRLQLVSSEFENV